MLKRNDQSRDRLNSDRLLRLRRRRDLKMARSPHAFVRGATQNFYDWLDKSPGKMPEGPPVWICGDCHAGNLGPIADAEGWVAVQIRDLDQTAIANPAYDLVRLGLSLASAARSSDLPGVTTVILLEALLAGYEGALGRDGPADQSHRPKPVQKLLHRSLRRRWRHLAAEWLELRKPRLPLGKRFWPLTDGERAAVSGLFSACPLSPLVCGLERGEALEAELVDAAFWVKGCSSLGRLRYAALLRVKELGHDQLCLVDIKEAISPAVPRRKEDSMPADPACRVMAGALALSPNLGERMLAASLFGRPVTLRELTPHDLKIELGRLSRDKVARLAHYLGGVFGSAHGRQLDRAGRRSWITELKARSGEGVSASWLWTSVVELLAIHEAAYLEHCRRFPPP